MPNLGVVIMGFYRATQGGTGKHPRNTMVVPETATPGYTEAQQTIPPKFARNQLNLLVQNATRNFNTWRAENVLPPADTLAATQVMTRGPEGSCIEQMCNVPNNLGSIGMLDFLHSELMKCAAGAPPEEIQAAFAAKGLKAMLDYKENLERLWAQLRALNRKAEAVKNIVPFFPRFFSSKNKNSTFTFA